MVLNFPQASPEGSELVSELLSHHRTQLTLCEQLEQVADSLPNNVDNQICLSLARRIGAVVSEAHRFEEETIFPLLSKATGNDAGVARSLDRLKFEHWEDESAAEDLSVSLAEMVTHPTNANFDKISYMLRGFFEGLRRHIAFETDHLLPLLEAELGAIRSPDQPVS